MKKHLKKISLLLIFFMSIWSCEEENNVGFPTNTLKPEASFSVKADKYQAGQKIEFTDLSEDKDGFITS